MKSLALTSPYWAARGFQRILTLDCGMSAANAPLSAFFTEIDSSGRIVAEDDAAMVFGEDCAQTQPLLGTLASQFHPGA